ncbi:UNVERIFIED_CONTAM: hypothetical protein K2H54_028005 [Gekko kuhli]
MWWDCPGVKKFWDQIGIEMSGMVGRGVRISKAMAFINPERIGLRLKEESKWINLMLIAARLVIARNWKEAEELTVNHWRDKMNNIIILEYLTMKIRKMNGLKVRKQEEDWFRRMVGFLGKYKRFGMIRQLIGN